jgi:hypothetical protein
MSMAKTALEMPSAWMILFRSISFMIFNQAGNVPPPIVWF